MLNNLLHSVSKLRMSGTTLLLSLYAFTVCTGTTLFFVGANEKYTSMPFSILLLFNSIAIFCTILCLFRLVFCVDVFQGFIVYTSIMVCVAIHRL